MNADRATATADVWIVPIPGDAVAVLRAAATLSIDERRKAERFAFDADRVRFIVARGATRVLLGRALGRQPRDLVFEATPRGKPLLADRALHFNLSHSGRYVVVGLSRDSEIGVDTEWVARPADVGKLAQRYFAPQEVAWLTAVPRERQRERFFRLWTIKEALLKATGDGLGRPLSRIVVTFASDGPPAISASRWAAEESTAVPGHATAAAVRPGTRICWHPPADADGSSYFE